MVSEKLIVILLIIAIVLSLVSTVITLSGLSKNSVPAVTISTGKERDTAQGKVSIIINPYQGEPIK